MIEEARGLGDDVARGEIADYSDTVEALRDVVEDSESELPPVDAEWTVKRALQIRALARVLKLAATGEIVSGVEDEELGGLFRVLLDARLVADQEIRSGLAQLLGRLAPELLDQEALHRPGLKRRLTWATVARLVDTMLEDLKDPEVDKRARSLDRIGEVVTLVIERGKQETLARILHALAVRLVQEEEDLDLCHALGRILADLAVGETVRSHLPMLEDLVLTLRVGVDMDEVKAARPGARDRTVSQVCHNVLERLSSERMVDDLLRHLGSSSEQRRLQAEGILGSLEGHAVVARLIENLGSSDRGLQSRAYRSLVQLKEVAQQQLWEVIESLKDPKILPREAGGKKLSETGWLTLRNVLGVLTETRDERMDELIVIAARDTDPRLRAEVLELQLVHRIPSAGKWAVELLQDPDFEVVETALRILGAAPHEDAPAALIELFWARPGFRNRALRLMGRVGGPESVEFLGSYLRGADPKLNEIFQRDEALQRLAYSALADIGTPAAAGHLKAYIDRCDRSDWRRRLKPWVKRAHTKEGREAAVYALATLQSRQKSRRRRDESAAPQTIEEG